LGSGRAAKNDGIAKSSLLFPHAARWVKLAAAGPLASATIRKITAMNVATDPIIATSAWASGGYCALQRPAKLAAMASARRRGTIHRKGELCRSGCVVHSKSICAASAEGNGRLGAADARARRFFAPLS